MIFKNSVLSLIFSALVILSCKEADLTSSTRIDPNEEDLVGIPDGSSGGPSDGSGSGDPSDGSGSGDSSDGSGSGDSSDGSGSGDSSDGSGSGDSSDGSGSGDSSDGSGSGDSSDGSGSGDPSNGSGSGDPSDGSGSGSATGSPGSGTTGTDITICKGSDGNFDLNFRPEIQGCIDGSTNTSPSIYNFAGKSCSSVPATTSFNCNHDDFVRYSKSRSINTASLEAAKSADNIYVGCGVKNVNGAEYIFGQFYTKPVKSFDDDKCLEVTDNPGSITTICYVSGALPPSLDVIQKEKVRLNQELQGLSGEARDAKIRELIVEDNKFIQECFALTR